MDGQINKDRLIKVIVFTIILLLLATAIVLMLWKPLQDLQRGNQTKIFLQKIKEGETTVIADREDFKVEGEGYEEFEVLITESIPASNDSQNDSQPEVTSAQDDVVLTAVGIITINAIDLELPLWVGAGVVPLRYGAGMLQGTASPGQEGNLVILGHRMKAYGSLFNRLGEIEMCDQIEVTTVDGSVYTYTVDQIIPQLVPADLSNYVKIDSGSGTQLTLVTCTPTGVGSHRLVVIAHITTN